MRTTRMRKTAPGPEAALVQCCVLHLASTTAQRSAASRNRFGGAIFLGGAFGGAKGEKIVKPIIFEADRREITMSNVDVSLFRAHYCATGNAWRVLCYCTGCLVVCFEGNLCGCAGHTASRRAYDVANHRKLADVPEVIERIRKAAS